MASVNKVILVGNLGADPEMRSTAGGDAVCTLRLGTSEQWKDKDGQDRYTTEVEAREMKMLGGVSSGTPNMDHRDRRGGDYLDESRPMSSPGGATGNIPDDDDIPFWSGLHGDTAEKSETHLVALITIMAWVQVMLADLFGLFGASAVVMALLGTLYAASCLGLYLIRRSGGPMPWIIPWGGALVLAWCLFVLYGTLLDSVRLQDLVVAPSRAGLALLFANGPVIAVIAGVVLAYPLAVLYGRGAGVMAIVIAMPGFAFYASGLIEADFSRLSFTLMVLEMVWLYVALRIVPQLAVGVVTRQSPRVTTKQ